MKIMFQNAEPAPAEFVWHPDPKVVEASNLTAFMNYVGVQDYSELLKRGDGDPAWFWEAVLNFFDIRFYKPYEKIMDSSKGLPWTKWCVDGTTNIVLNCLDRHRGTPVFDQTFILWDGENGETRSVTYAEFDREVSRFAGGLRKLGYGRGDVIGLYMPNLVETYVAYLAIMKIGGVVMPLFSGYASQAMADRLNLGGAKALITADATYRRGQLSPMKDTADAAVALAPNVRNTIVVRRANHPTAWDSKRDIWWDDVVRDQPDEAPTEEMQAEDPAMLMFTSGTTGKPKGCVYTHVGFVAKMMVDGALMTDFKASDRYFWMADMGWLAGAYAVVVPTMLGGSLLVAEGAPDYPKPDRFWALVQDYDVTYLGLVPTMVRQAMRSGTDFVAGRDFSKLRVIYTGGEPWAERPWMWLLEHVCHNRVAICNGSGGTELGGCIVFATLSHASKPCSIPVAVPGLGVDIVDDDGNSVGPGQIGELIMRNPSMSLTVGLWNDPDRYIDSYWSRFPNVWVHGDLCSRDEDGLWYVHGRSDDTLKFAGKRTGPAEIESVFLASGRISEAAAVGVPDEIKGESLIVVCTPMPGEAPDDELRRLLSDLIVSKLGKAYKPNRIYFSLDLPKTRNMKIMRRAVRSALTGSAIGDTSALVNPESLDAIASLVAQ
ncbi:acyl-CoA synthetase/AMP-acid ligase [Pseudomonas sp. GM33]|uniref:AMP-binding protein n=1 Tax=Pseudomonas sp. GM33 TaxID=1144329 RepID=UPI00026FF1EA|nr:AMP-binding protein [Pseudomonas sp. GM33]EJM34488.1 acyl-CoA synthetase/AMP-acid ligase [Pseudomonas sp. GM33]